MQKYRTYVLLGYIVFCFLLTILTSGCNRLNYEIKQERQEEIQQEQREQMRQNRERLQEQQEEIREEQRERR